MRQMAGHGEHQVVMLGIHDLDIGAQLFPEGLEPLDITLGRIVRRGQDAPAVVEQGRKAGIRAAVLGTGDGMGRNDPGAGQRCGKRGLHAVLGRSDIADHRIGGQIGSDLGGDIRHHADRHAENHQIGVGNRGAGAVADIVAEAKLEHALSHRRIAVIAGDPHRGHGLADGMGDRGADQPEPDNGNLGKGQHQPAASSISRSAVATPRVSSSVPMVILRPLTRPWPGSQRTA